MRRLLLMRHGRAHVSGPGRDDARELTPEGWRQGRRVGERLTAMAPSRILSSPAIRCVRTAEAVLVGLGWADRLGIAVHAELGCDDGRACLPLVAGSPGVSLIVSHHPTLLGLSAALLARAPPVDLRPGQVAILEEVEGWWTLASILDPGPGT